MPLLFPALSLTLIITLPLEMKDCTQFIHLAENIIICFLKIYFYLYQILFYLLSNKTYSVPLKNGKSGPRAHKG